MEKQKKVKPGHLVTFSYQGTLEDGTIFDRKESFTYVVGSGLVNPFFEHYLMNMGEKEKKNFKIKPEEAYGLYNENLIIEVPIKKFPQKMEMHIGMLLNLPLKKLKQTYPMKIIGISDISVTVDANHPLAGQTLFYEVEVIEIKLQNK